MAQSAEYKLAIQIAGSLSSSFQSSVGEAQSRLAALGSAAGKVMKAAAGASAAAAAAMGAFAVSSVKTGMEFDSAMSQVAATMGTTVDEIQDLRGFAQEMGASTAFSATEAAEALNYMALAGYSADQSMEMLPKVLSLAAAGGIDLASASDMVTDAQSALGLTSGQTAAMVDQMARASSKTNTSVAQLGEAILTIGATGKTAAGGTAELNQVLGILADNGIKGSEGGTHLRNMMLSLQSPTAKAAKAMESLGLSVFDSQGDFREMQDIFLELQASLDGMSGQEQADILSTMFNKTDLAAVNALLGTSAERWDEVAGALEDCEGAADAMAATQLDNLSGDITLFQSALEGAQIAVSDQLTPSLRQFVQFGSEGLSELTTAFQSGGLDGAMEALGGILSDGLGLITEQIPGFMSAGMKLLGALGQGLLDNLPAITSAALDVALMLVEGLVSAFPALAEGGAQLLSQLALGIADAVPELVPALASAVVQIADTLTDPGTLNALLDGALAVILALADGLMQALPVLIGAVPGIVGNLVSALAAAGPRLAAAGAQLLSSLAAGAPAAMGALLAGIQAGLDAVGAFLQAKVPFLGAIFTGWSASISAVMENVKAMFTAVIDFIGNVFAGNWSAAWTNIRDVFGNLFGGIVNLAKAPMNGVISAINFVLDKINSISITIPDWVPVVGGRSLGFSIPPIPQMAEGGIVTGPTLLEAGEAGDEAIIPLPELWSNLDGLMAGTVDSAAERLAQALEPGAAGPPLSGLLEGGADRPAEPGNGGTPLVIYYQPHLHFEGGAPSREDIVEAGRISQEEFNRMAARWLKDAARLSLRR